MPRWGRPKKKGRRPAQYAALTAEHLRAAIYRLGKLHEQATFVMPEDGFYIALQFSQRELIDLGCVLNAAESRLKSFKRAYHKVRDPDPLHITSIRYPSHFKVLREGDPYNAGL